MERVVTSGVGARVDGKILGYSPQDLLLGLSAIFALQQLLVRVGQLELRGAEWREKAQPSDPLVPQAQSWLNIADNPPPQKKLCD